MNPTTAFPQAIDQTCSIYHLFSLCQVSLAAARGSSKQWLISKSLTDAVRFRVSGVRVFVIVAFDDDQVDTLIYPGFDGVVG